MNAISDETQDVTIRGQTGCVVHEYARREGHRVAVTVDDWNRGTAARTCTERNDIFTRSSGRKQTTVREIAILVHARYRTNEPAAFPTNVVFTYVIESESPCNVAPIPPDQSAMSTEDKQSRIRVAVE